MRIFEKRKLVYPPVWGGKPEPVALYVEKYGNNRTALQLISLDEAGNEVEPFMRCTVNLATELCPMHEVWVKDYAENEGCAAWLIKEEFIEPKPSSVALSGHVAIYRYKLHSSVIQECIRVLSKQMREG